MIVIIYLYTFHFFISIFILLPLLLYFHFSSTFFYFLEFLFPLFSSVQEVGALGEGAQWNLFCQDASLPPGDSPFQKMDRTSVKCPFASKDTPLHLDHHPLLCSLFYFFIHIFSLPSFLLLHSILHAVFPPFLFSLFSICLHITGNVQYGDVHPQIFISFK